jgi:hypothetical protein
MKVANGKNLNDINGAVRLRPFRTDLTAPGEILPNTQIHPHHLDDHGNALKCPLDCAVSPCCN